MRALQRLFGLLLNIQLLISVASAGCYPGSFGSVKLLLVFADTDGSWSLSVKRELQNTADFSSIGMFDGRTGTPQLSVLRLYDVVLVWSTGTGFRDAKLLGDVLADYWDSNGAVVVAMFANHRSRILGRFGDFANGYMLIDGTHTGHVSKPSELGEV